MGVAAELRASNVSVIEKAESPLSPSKPRKTLSLILSAVVGLMGGVGVAFFLEYLDNTLKTPEEVERYLGLPNLAVVPDFTRLHNRNHDAAPRKQGETEGRSLVQKSQELVLAHHPLSVVTESYRAFRTGILLSRAGEPPRTILFTSGTRAEGKTATTVNTAVIFAQMGVKVLVIDADLRRPRCHKVLGITNGPGLTELLTGQYDPHHLIKPTAMDNFFFLRSGAVPPNPAELVGSRKMQETLARLQESYDYILIDSPPVMPVSDAVLLSTMVDGVVMVVDSQETPKYVVKEACVRLGYAQAKILGMVLNRLDIHRGDYAYYYRHYYSYYHSHESV
jgi:capsular exopolysaccharide synthesis family protein